VQKFSERSNATEPGIVQAPCLDPECQVVTAPVKKHHERVLFTSDTEYNPRTVGFIHNDELGVVHR
jgi:hypothetical protein